MTETNDPTPKDFIRQIVAADLAGREGGGRLQTRFPPEPNGYLHLGHAKSICLNFGLAEEFGGKCNLRFDDTNPAKEDSEYVESIKEDVRWLGFEWDRECYTSDYFERLYGYAVQLIEMGLAYVCELTAEEMRSYRGSLVEPGRNSPFRERLPEENRDLFSRMRAGEFPDGSLTLRAKVDMGHPNLNMRDPVLYRVRRDHHHRTGNLWCIYPSYDFAHGQSDAIEEVTHSICTLEFEDHRPLYDWFIDKLGIYPSRQYEFARLNLTYTVMSKRKLKELVDRGLVRGWNDPRMPTLSGIRRRGVPPEAVRRFCELIGVTRFTGVTDLALFEHAIREVLNRRAERRMAVLNPLPIVLSNLEDGEVVEVEALNNPEDEGKGNRILKLGKHLLIERDDFMEDAPKKFFRLAPGKEVRLRHGFVIRCDAVIKDASGRVSALHCTADRETLGRPPEGRKVKGVIHWVNADDAIEGEARIYERLFSVERPDAEKERDFTELLRPDSEVIARVWMEPSLGEIPIGSAVQFERIGYFAPDLDSKAGAPVFNRVVALKDSFPKN
ncbi:MAG: glutamine--tRNA ligase/YqeY domain fusion protein [Puniceicoccaceae bacterium]